MRRRAATIAGALAAASLACAAGGSFPVGLHRTAEVGGVTATLRVPRSLEPTGLGRSGTYFPTGQPAVLLWPDKDSPAAERSFQVQALNGLGLVVLELPAGGAPGDPAAALRDAEEALAAFRESRGGSVALMAIEPPPGLVGAALDDRALAALAFLGLDPPGGPMRQEPFRRPVLVANLEGRYAAVEDLSGRLTALIGRPPVEKHYERKEESRRLPPEAARDAAGWLVSVLTER